MLFRSVPNTLWTSVREDAYRSEAPAFTHLRELEGSIHLRLPGERWDRRPALANGRGDP